VVRNVLPKESPERVLRNQESLVVRNQENLPVNLEVRNLKDTLESTTRSIPRNIKL